MLITPVRNKSSMVGLRIPDYQLVQLRRLSNQYGIRLSETIRQVLELGLKQIPQVSVEQADKYSVNKIEGNDNGQASNKL